MNRNQCSLNATLESLKLQCPPLPQTLIEVTKLLDDPQQLEVGPVTEMVQRDPIVVAQLLHIANSAYYGLRRTIGSVKWTVVMLGTVTVVGIVGAMNNLKRNSVLEGPAGRCLDRLIRHSIATAFLVRYLLEGAPRWGTGYSKENASGVGVSYTAGLLHDFGKIILVYNYPEEAVALYEKRTLDELLREPDVRNLEQLVFGCDHTEVGEYAARKFGFPDSLIDVVRFHHEPERTSGDPETDRLVRATVAANLAAKAMGYAFDRGVDWKTAACDPIWEQLVENDLPHVEDVASLMEDLQQQQEPLEHYVLGAADAGGGACLLTQAVHDAAAADGPAAAAQGRHRA